MRIPFNCFRFVHLVFFSHIGVVQWFWSLIWHSISISPLLRSPLFNRSPGSKEFVGTTDVDDVVVASKVHKKVIPLSLGYLKSSNYKCWVVRHTRSTRIVKGNKGSGYLYYTSSGSTYYVCHLDTVSTPRTWVLSGLDCFSFRRVWKRLSLRNGNNRTFALYRYKTGTPFVVEIKSSDKRYIIETLVWDSLLTSSRNLSKEGCHYPCIKLFGRNDGFHKYKYINNNYLFFSLTYVRWLSRYKNILPHFLVRGQFWLSRRRRTEVVGLWYTDPVDLSNQWIYRETSIYVL